ncbi:unnamed protein product [Urochloa decumbens]|uniref:Protein kinase domain-containing protein n=1 Tax=Urochloa decumbens TaxID=240449 RepID=A0ABC9AZ29_9POAL
MADIAFGSVEKIVKVGLAIKEAVDTVCQNQEECKEIQKVVASVSAILSQLQQAKVLKGPAVDGALMGLEESLDRALKLVMECQEGHIVRRFFTAGDMSKELRRVQDDITQKMMLGLFAVNIQATIILTNLGSAGAHHHPLPSQQQDIDVAEVSQCSNSSVDDEDVSRSQVNVEGSEVPAPLTPDDAEQSYIGKGGFSTVYKGVLHGEFVVAIKYMISEDLFTQQMMDFYCNNGPKLQHKSIVKFLGYGVKDRLKWRWFKNISYEKRLPILVEEYMPNGSLKDIVNEPQLDWSSCFCIFKGITQALHFLHQKRIVHKDVKPANILLDYDMNPKLADFGAAQVLHGTDDYVFENYVIGDMNYIDPVYMTTGRLSTKSDVYNFGVTLLETFRGMCGSKPPPDDKMPPVKWAWAVHQDGQMKDLFDPSLSNESQLEEIKRLLAIGLVCTEYDQNDRPTMLDVLEMLDGKKEVPVPTERNR